MFAHFIWAHGAIDEQPDFGLRGALRYRVDEPVATLATFPLTAVVFDRHRFTTDDGQHVAAYVERGMDLDAACDVLMRRLGDIGSRSAE